MLKGKFASLNFIVVAIVFLLKWNINVVLIARFMLVVTIREEIR